MVNLLSECGSNLTGQENGIITSPGFPDTYEPHRKICNWYIAVRPRYKILLYFDYFQVEGDPIGNV